MIKVEFILTSGLGSPVEAMNKELVEWPTVPKIDDVLIVPGGNRYSVVHCDFIMDERLNFVLDHVRVYVKR